MAGTADCRIVLASLAEVEARLPGPGTAWLTAGEDLRLQGIVAALRRHLGGLEAACLFVEHEQIGESAANVSGQANWGVRFCVREVGSGHGGMG